MLSLRESDIKKLERLGSGAYGTVYKFDEDLAVKIYHPEIKSFFGGSKDNPQLRKRRRALRIRRIGKEIEYSDLVRDLAYVDGHYAGIVIPYYDGVTLNNMMDAPFDLKIEISKQLVRNCKELTDKFIYPTDFKLNNMMYVDGEVKFIDLDDAFTKYFYIGSEAYKRDAIGGLDESIKTLFGEYRYSCYTDWLRYYLSRERPETMREYDGINTYLEDKNTPRNYLFIDVDSDINAIKKLNKKGNYRIILLYQKNTDFDEYYSDFFRKLEMNGIYVYDMITRDDFDIYFSNNRSKEMQFVKRK